MMYRPPLNLSENNNNLSQFILYFAVHREVILIGHCNLPSIDWGNVHPFQGETEPTTQALVDAFVSSGLSQWVTKFSFFRPGNTLDLVFTSAINLIGDAKIHCPFPHCGHCVQSFLTIYLTFVMN